MIHQTVAPVLRRFGLWFQNHGTHINPLDASLHIVRIGTRKDPSTPFFRPTLREYRRALPHRSSVCFSASRCSPGILRLRTSPFLRWFSRPSAPGPTRFVRRQTLPGRPKILQRQAGIEMKETFWGGVSWFGSESCFA